ncbi:hypothetical protein ER57_12705 [Smithella sp. SCADC]|nr:hypothetical protein ER57_12705 [Smithella sp. SCADC]
MKIITSKNLFLVLCSFFLKKHYFILAKEASDIWDYLEKAKGGNGSQNYDTYFLMGLFHYHLKHVSGIIRFLSSALIIPGSHQKGLQELELAAKIL